MPDLDVFSSPPAIVRARCGICGRSHWGLTLRRVWLAWVVGMGMASAGSEGNFAAPLTEQKPPKKSPWAFELGHAWITSDNVGDILLGNVHIAHGDVGGQIYSLTATYRLGERSWTVGDHVFHPQLELPQTLEIVDENGRNPFPTYNSSFFVRWVDFPWNHLVKTTFGMGLGLSYTEKVYLIDIERHRWDSDRSRLKFNWPIQLTFASPKYPELQAMIFIGHHSGGHIFDIGGTNSLGVGCRLEL